MGGGNIGPLNVVYVAVTTSDRVVYSEVGTWGGGRILEPLMLLMWTTSNRVVYSVVGSVLLGCGVVAW